MTTSLIAAVLVIFGVALLVAWTWENKPTLISTLKRFLLVIFATQIGWTSVVVASPIITFDSREGAGQNIYTTQGVHYDAGDAFWAVSAKALAISFDNGFTFTSLINGTVDLRGHFLSSSVNGGMVTGQFTTFGSGASLDLIVADQTGLLIAGTYGARQINGILATDSGNSQSTFNADSGSLASLWPAEPFSGRMVNSLFGITPIFSANSFTQNFDGEINGTISAVPAPPAFVLLISGIATLFYRNRRR
jgi:hypothetical protein